MVAPNGTDDIYVPVINLTGDVTLPFTTDSHLLSNEWLPGEVIVEAFEFVLPPADVWDGGTVGVRLQNLSRNEDAGFEVGVGTIEYQPYLQSAKPDMLASFRERAALRRATARIGLGQQRSAPWDAPIYAQSGDTIHLTLQWQVLATPEDSYTIFVHLIDFGNRPIIDNLDYTPLGGATPSHLWFPKWLPGQTMLDPYQMKLDGVAPGEYLIEVGIYEQFTKRRLHIYDEQGNINGDRFILGAVVVE